MDLSDQREEYQPDPIDIDSVSKCPFEQFDTWLKVALEKGIAEPNAMSLATVDDSGCPSLRTVLLKYFDTGGFVFYTNYSSRKATQIAGNPHVTMLFFWRELHRQVEISGQASKVSTAESIKYFATRPRGSQLGAWVSNQSAVVSGRSVLMNKMAELTRKFSDGEIPMPSFWGGFRVIPTRLEFWQGGANRLHDRIEYSRSDASSAWTLSRLAP